MTRSLLLVLLLLGLSGCLHSKLNDAALHPRSTFRMIPEDRHLEYRPFAVDVDGAKIHAWFFPAQGDGPPARDAVVLCGGNTGNKSLYLVFAEELVAAGYHVVLFDYRGFGLSTGGPDLWSLIGDARRVVAAVKARPDVDRVALYGISLGSVVALGTAAAAPDDVEVVVVEGVVNPDAKLREIVGGFVAALGGFFVVPSGWDVADHAEEIRQPLLFLHSAEDGVTPLADAVRIFLAAGEARAPRAFWIAEGAGHAPGIAGRYGFEVSDIVRRWLDRWLRKEKAVPWFDVDWEPAEGGVLVRLRPRGPAPERTPVEVALVPEEAAPEFRRIWFTPGGKNEFRLRAAAPPTAVFASVPAVPVVTTGSGWARDDLYQRSRAEWEGLEDHLYDALGYGHLVRRFDQRIFFHFGEEPDEAAILAACAEYSERLEAVLAGEVHPLVRPMYADAWAAIARRYERVHRPAQAIAAYERAVALVPAEPFAHFWFGNASWELGWDLSAVAGRLRKMAALAEGETAKAGYRERAEAWQRRADDRARRIGSWTRTQRAVE